MDTARALMLKRNAVLFGYSIHRLDPEAAPRIWVLGLESGERYTLCRSPAHPQWLYPIRESNGHCEGPGGIIWWEDATGTPKPLKVTH